MVKELADLRHCIYIHIISLHNHTYVLASKRQQSNIYKENSYQQLQQYLQNLPHIYRSCSLSIILPSTFIKIGCLHRKNSCIMVRLPINQTQKTIIHYLRNLREDSSSASLSSLGQNRTHSHPKSLPHYRCFR